MKKIFFCALALCAITQFFSCSKKIDSEYASHFVLANGLNVFVKEDHKVPLAYFEIAVRCGAITQREDNAGIFHLYEHMMFKGNSLYENASAVQRALTDLGVTNWNGSTGVECVNYFFTVPSNELKKGMEFWSAAIRTPKLDEKEFENEKKVVVSEIAAKLDSPGTILWQFFIKTFFPDAPWQLDSSGTVETVQKATLSELKSIKEKYYVPNNCAIFVGGDVTLEQVKNLSEEIFGDWERSDFDFSSETIIQDLAPLDETKFFVLPNDQISPQIAQTMIYFRGADSDFALMDSYPLDVFSDYINDPESTFCKTLCENEELQIISNDYVGGGYSTERRTATINFYCVMKEPERSIPSRVKKFYSAVTEDIVPEYIHGKNIVPKEKFKRMLQSKKDGKIISSEQCENVLSSARWHWLCADADYYYNYQKFYSRVKNRDISRALEKYLSGKNAFVVVCVHPSVYNNLKAEFDGENFTEIKKEDAFWWKAKN